MGTESTPAPGIGAHVNIPDKLGNTAALLMGTESTPAPGIGAHVNIPDKLDPVLRFTPGQGEPHAGVPTARVKPG